MKKHPRKKTRSIASYRASSLKAGRTREKMAMARKAYMAGYAHGVATERKSPGVISIDLIPKVNWP